MDRQPMNIICFGSTYQNRWLENWQRHQEIVTRLATDFNLIYIESFGFTSLLYKVRSIPRRLMQKFCIPADEPQSAKHSLQGENSRIKFIRLRVFPVYEGFFSTLNAWFLKRQIDKLLVQDGVNVFWFAYPNPIFPRLIRAFKNIPSVYDCCQRYKYKQEFPPAFIGAEEELTKEADLVFVDSLVLYSEKQRLNPNTVRVHQGINTATKAAAVEQSSRRAVTIGYIGSLNQALDIELIKYIAGKRRQWQIELVGISPFHQELFAGYGNIVCRGHFKRAELGEFIQQFAVGLIPYRVDEFTEGVFPTKFFEYLAYNKPVVSTYLPDLLEFTDFVDVAQGYEDFLTKIDLALENRKFAAEDCQRLLEANSWTNKYAVIRERLLTLVS